MLIIINDVVKIEVYRKQAVPKQKLNNPPKMYKENIVYIQMFDLINVLSTLVNTVYCLIYDN